MTRRVDLSFLIGSRSGDEFAFSELEILRAEEWIVRERWFTGSVSLQIGGACLECDDIPLLDFALALRYSVDALAVDGVAAICVAGGPTVQLEVVGSVVQARIGDSGEIAVCEFIDLAHASGVFRRELVDEIVERRPEYLLNDTIERIYRESGARELSRERFLMHTQMMRMRSAMIRNDHV